MLPWLLLLPVCVGRPKGREIKRVVIRARYTSNSLGLESTAPLTPDLRRLGFRRTKR